MLEENQNIADNVDMARKNVIALVDCDSFLFPASRLLTLNSKENLFVLCLAAVSVLSPDPKRPKNSA